MSTRPPVWITGVGAATPLGDDYAAIADSLLEGRSAVRAIETFDVREHPCRIGAQLGSIRCPSGWNEDEFRALVLPDQLAAWCCTAALRDSGWWERRHSARIGLVLGVGSGCMRIWEADLNQGGKVAIDPAEATETQTQVLRRTLGLSGPILGVAAACAGASYAISQGRRLVEMGWVDCCLAGGCDLAITPMALAGFGNLRALSRRNDQPEAASRPFDRNRDGFVMGEGGAVFVLEPASTARRRGARAYAQVAGCGATSDAYHMVIPCPDPGPAAACMKQAFADARIAPDAVDYVNAHATSTSVGDAGEARVLHAVLGSRADSVPVSSTKSMTGHLLTGAAAVEALACIIALQRQTLPPTINLDEPDPECDLFHVRNQAMERAVSVTVSNSFGFGGSNTCLVLKQAA